MSHEIGNINTNMDTYLKLCLKCNSNKHHFGSIMFCKSLISARDRLTRVSARLTKVSARLGLV